MQRLLAQPGFINLVVVAFINAWVDLGHKIVIQNTVFEVYDGPLQIALTGIVNALILLPFALMLTPAGFLSDRFRKDHVMQYAAFAAVVLTALITLFYWLGWFWPAFAMTLALAIQATIYSPAKLGYLRERVETGDLSAANGVIQAATTVAILASMLVYSFLFEAHAADVPVADRSDATLIREMTPLGLYLVLGSVLEWLLTLRLPASRHQNAALRFDLASYRSGAYLRENMGGLSGHPVLWWSTIGLAVFWSLAQGLIAIYPSWAEASLGMKSVTQIQLIMATASIGIVAGSLSAGALSAGRIDLGYVPIGAAGIAGCLIAMPLLTASHWQFLLFGGLGFFGGLFVVPLESLIQFHSPADNIGRLLAASNVVRNIVMIGLLAVTVIAAFAGVGSGWLMALLMLVAGLGTLYTVYRLPRSLLALALQWVFGCRYQIEVSGLEHLPNRGGVLLLGNHVSWIDWAILILASPRPVRFVMSRMVYERWYWKPVLDIAGVVPISPKGALGAIERVAECLRAGEVVCLFPEGTLSRHGQLNPFKPGFERVAELAADSGAVIMPFYLRGLWGSRFSNAGPGLRSGSILGRRRRVILALGAPAPLDTTAATVKQQVATLSVGAWSGHVERLETLPRAWLRQVQLWPGAVAVIESSGERLSRQRLAAAVLCFAHLLSPMLKAQPRVGILLPPSAGGLIANLACMLLGRTVVNLNYSASPAAIAAAISEAGITTVLGSRRFTERLQERGLDLDTALAGARVIELEELRPRVRPWQGLAAMVAVRLLPAWLICRMFGAARDNTREAVILFSSGSEGRPKGVVLAHRNLVGNIEQVTDLLNFNRNDVMLGCLPLFHAFGLTVTSLLPLVQGLPVVTHPDPTDALGLARAVARYRASIMCATPTFMRLYTRNTRVHPLMFESLRLVVSGAERLDPAVREGFHARFGKLVFEGYGATETTPVVSVNVPDYLDSSDWSLHLGSRAGSVGQPLPGTCVRIVDPVSLKPMPAGQDGLILIGGVQVMQGYLNDPERTAEAVIEQDGLRWYRTGDKGHLDDDGFLTIVDRYSRFAKVGGEMVSLGAVEAGLRAALNEAELELVVVALPDVRKGERLVALVREGAVDLEDSAALRKRLLDHGMPPLSLPDTWISVAAIPQLGSGKTDFSRAKALAAELAAAS